MKFKIDTVKYPTQSSTNSDYIFDSAFQYLYQVYSWGPKTSSSVGEDGWNFEKAFDNKIHAENYAKSLAKFRKLKIEIIISEELEF